MGDLLYDRLLAPLMGAIFLCALAALEWWRWATSAPPQPVVVSVMAGIAVLFVIRRFLTVRRELKTLRLGLEGEKSVAQYLEANRDVGWRLLHDLPGDGFNVDHVLVTPRGVYAIETKTISKPERGDAKVVFDGEKVFVNGMTPDRDPVAQARAARDWIRSVLQETTGRHFPVRAVILYPGWFVTRTDSRARSDTWVLNEKALRGFIEHEPTVIKPEDVALVASRLAEHVVRWQPSR
jgi:hypothetical protein